MNNYNSVYGTLAADAQVVNLDVRGMNHAALNIAGTFVGTVLFEATIDGTTWFAIKDQLGGASATSATSIGQFTFNVGGFQEIRARMHPYTSGSAVIALASSLA